MLLETKATYNIWCTKSQENGTSNHLMPLGWLNRFAFVHARLVIDLNYNFIMYLSFELCTSINMAFKAYESIFAGGKS